MSLRRSGAALMALIMLSSATSKADVRSQRILPFTPWLVGHIKRMEGLRLTRYKDAHAYSIGYGHQIKATGPRRVTKEWAEKSLRSDIKRFHQVVMRSVKQPITQNQHDGLVAFAYNVGPRGFQRSTALKAFNQGNMDRFGHEFLKYTKAGGKKRGYLARRRRVELQKIGGYKPCVNS